MLTFICIVVLYEDRPRLFQISLRSHDLKNWNQRGTFFMLTSSLSVTDLLCSLFCFVCCVSLYLTWTLTHHLLCPWNTLIQTPLTTTYIYSIITLITHVVENNVLWTFECFFFFSLRALRAKASIDISVFCVYLVEHNIKPSKASITVTLCDITHHWVVLGVNCGIPERQAYDFTVRTHY